MTGKDGFVAIVLAAGQGTRMKSTRPKVLHEVAGRPMVSWPVQAALDAGAEHVVVVVGYGREEVEQALRERFDQRVSTAIQAEQRGTGDAVRCGLEAVPSHPTRILVLYGDCPLLRGETLAGVVREAERAAMPLGMVTAHLDDPGGYGRVLRDADNRIVAVREERDCTNTELQIHEINPGIYAVATEFLRRSIATLSTENAQGELYLTDVVAAAAQHTGVASVSRHIDELLGINDRQELTRADRLMRERINEALARSGVTVRDSRATFIDADVTVEPDAVIEPQVHLRGRCHVGASAHIDVGCVLQEVEVDSGAVLLPYTVATNSRIGESARVGPFAHLRDRTDLGAEARVGNFVETKNTRMGRGAKANHLAYVGDGEIGDDVNVGAGTIFCNYDGYEKHTTVLEEGVFIGSDSQLIAPVRVGKGAYVASGSTVTRDVPPDALAVARARQQNKEGYAARLRRKLEAAKRRAKGEKG